MTDFKSIGSVARSGPVKKNRKILLLDHTDDSDSDQTGDGSTSPGPFCISCTLTDPQLSGSNARGGYVTYLCTLELNDGTIHAIRTRYSQCLNLRLRVRLARPDVYVPQLPPKSYTQTAGSRFVEHRRTGMEFFLRTVALNPDLGGLPAVQEWFEISQNVQKSSQDPGESPEPTL